MKPSKQRNPPIRKDLLRYTAVAAAATGAGAVGNASAAVLYSGPVNQSVTTTTQLNISLFTSSAQSFPNSNNPPNGELGFYYYTSGSDFWVRQSRNGSFNPLDMVAASAGNVVARFSDAGPAVSVPTDTNFDGAQQNLRLQPNFSGTTGFLAIRTATSETEYNAGNFNFGWVQVDYTNPNLLTVIDWAVESDVNTAIEIGAVPETSSAVLLSLGAVGLAAMRRRKTA